MNKTAPVLFSRDNINNVYPSKFRLTKNSWLDLEVRSPKPHKTFWTKSSFVFCRKNYEYDYPHDSKGYHPINLAGTSTKGIKSFSSVVKLNIYPGSISIPEQFLCRGSTISRYLGGPLVEILANTLPTLPLLPRDVACPIWSYLRLFRYYSMFLNVIPLQFFIHSDRHRFKYWFVFEFIGLLHCFWLLLASTSTLSTLLQCHPISFMLRFGSVFK